MKTNQPKPSSRHIRVEILLMTVSTLAAYLLFSFFRADLLIVRVVERFSNPQILNLLPTALFALIALAIYAYRRRRDAQAQALQKMLVEQKVEALAYYDPLTNLPNRTLSMDRLHQALEQARRDERMMALLFLDLDGFKNVNDSLGHSVGDQLLMAVTERLEPFIRKSDTFGRLGGDEFIFILNSCHDEQDITVFARRVVQILMDPIPVDGHAITCTASIGIATFPDDGDDCETLLRNADAAMYSAKHQGKNRYQFYASELNLRATERVQLESGLREALHRDEFEIYYQPQASLLTGEIIGVEALVRWRHPLRGLISPNKFMPIAEETGMIIPLGEWVLRQACRQLHQWHLAGFPHLQMAINISAHQLRYLHFPQSVAKALNDSEVSPTKIELEITEGALVYDIDAAQKVLNTLTEMGVSLAIDDFGTGFSSLKYLKYFHFHRLKIDQSFIRELLHNNHDAKIVLAMIALAKAMGMHVTAEGVEDWEQLSFLKDRHCDSFQGYIFSRPVTAEKVTQLLHSGKGVDLSFQFSPADLSPEDFDDTPAAPVSVVRQTAID